MKPVRVYLDSQDFSRFASSREGDLDHAIFSELGQLAEEGVAEFGLSYLHMVEVFTPTSGKYRSKERRKGQIIKKLCGNNAFPFLSDLVEGRTYPNEGIWYPRDMDLGDVNESGFAASLEQVRRSFRNERTLNRRQRRRLSSKSGFRDELRKAGPSVFKGKLEELGISSSKELFGIALGKRTETSFNKKALEALFDPTRHSEVVSLVREGSPLRELQKAKIEEPIKTMLGELFAQKEKLERHIQLLLAQQSLGLEVESRAIEELEAVRRNLPSIVQAAFEKVRERLGSEHFEHVPYWLGKAVLEDAAPKDSEITDMLHLCYCGGVNLHRVDKRVGGIMSDYAPFKGRLVANLKDLPCEIRKKASQV